MTLIMSILTFLFLIFLSNEMLKIKPELSSPVNFVRFGLSFYLVFLFASIILAFFLHSLIFNIIIITLIAVSQFIGFIGLNNLFRGMGNDFIPFNRVSSVSIVAYGSYGIVELSFTLIKEFSGSVGLWEALSWINTVLSFVVMIFFGVVMIIISEKLKKQIKLFKQTQERPNLALAAETESAGELKICENCGNKLLISDKHCSQCGHSVK